MASLWRDIRYALRQLARSPLFTVTAILALALGIGANSAMFALIDAAIVRPLPVANPDEVVYVWEDGSIWGFPRNTPAPANYFDWKAQNEIFTELAAARFANATIGGDGQPENVIGNRVTANFFPMLGVSPSVGRAISQEDEDRDLPVVVLSHALWLRRFGGKTEAIGRPILMDGRQVTVIGVMPPAFRFPNQIVEYWVPLAFTPQARAVRGSHFLTVMGRMKPGVTVQRADADMKQIARRLEQQYPDTNTKIGAVVVPLREMVAGNANTSLWMLLGASAAVLLIACANLANMLLSRNLGRQREIAVRTALGAPRLRVVRQLAAESLLLAGIGGMVAIGFAWAATQALVNILPLSLQSFATPSFDGRLLTANFIIAAATGLLFGLLPAWQATRADIVEGLKQNSRNAAGGASSRLRGLLVAAECALAILLLCGAGMLLKTLLRISSQETGFDTTNLLTMRVPMARPPYIGDDERTFAFYRDVEQRVRALPGVREAAFAANPPFATIGNTSGFFVEGQVPPKPGNNQDALDRAGTTAYLRMLKPVLIAGRLFDDTDRKDTQQVAVINKTLADVFFPKGDAVGKRLRFGGSSNPWREIIGVIQDIRERGYEVPLKYAVYYPIEQTKGQFATNLVVRTTGDPTAVANAVRQAIQSVDKDQAVAQIRTMSEVMDANLANRRRPALLFGVLAALALTLAVLGIYGVLAYNVTQRTREIGLRIALGAGRSTILGWVVGGGIKMAAVGLVVGLALSAALGRWLSSLLPEVDTADPWVFIATAVALLTVAAAAAAIPAWRASRVDPILALRDE